MTAVAQVREVRAHILERITLGVLGAPISARIGESEEWSPRIQGEVTTSDMLDLYPTVPAGVWKLQGDVITLQVETRYGAGITLADLTAAYGGSVAAVTAAHGGSVAAITQAFNRPWYPGEPLLPLSAATERWGGSVAAVTAEAGGSVAAITQALRRPGGSYLPAQTESVVYRLRKRVTTIDRIEGTATYQVASEDSRLHDYRHIETLPIVSGHDSLRRLVTEVLQRIAADAGSIHRIELAPGADTPIETGAIWPPGKTAWDFIAPILEAVGWQLYTPADGIYRLEPRTPTTAPVDLDKDVNLTRYVATEDLKDAFYDGALVEYTDAIPEDLAGRYDIYALPGAQRIMHETRPGVRTMPGAAEQLVTRSRTRARIADAEATLQLPLHAGQRVLVKPDGVQQHATIASLTHTLPAAETTFRLRDVTNG